MLITRESPWLRSGSNIYYNNGNVGIGVNDPIALLDVEKNVENDDPILRLSTVPPSVSSVSRDVAIWFTAEDDGSTPPPTTGSDWTIGIDSSDFYYFKISENTSLGTNDRFVIHSNGNVGIGTTALPTWGGFPVLTLAKASGFPTEVKPDTAGIFVMDVEPESGPTLAELHAFDEGGNVSLLSPHDPVTNKWIFDSLNIYSGKTIRIDMEILVRAVEALTGQIFIHEGMLPAGDIQDWDANQAAQVAMRDAQIVAFNTLTAEEQAQQVEPAVYVSKPKPDFLA